MFACVVFRGATSFNGDLSSWSTSRVTQMQYSTCNAVEAARALAHTHCFSGALSCSCFDGACVGCLDRHARIDSAYAGDDSVGWLTCARVHMLTVGGMCVCSVSGCDVFQRRLVVLGHIERDGHVAQYVYRAYAHAYSRWRFGGLAIALSRSHRQRLIGTR